MLCNRPAAGRRGLGSFPPSLRCHGSSSPPWGLGASHQCLREDDRSWDIHHSVVLVHPWFPLRASPAVNILPEDDHSWEFLSPARQHPRCHPGYAPNPASSGTQPVRTSPIDGDRGYLLTRGRPGPNQPRSPAGNPPVPDRRDRRDGRVKLLRRSCDYLCVRGRGRWLWRF